MVLPEKESNRTSLVNELIVLTKERDECKARMELSNRDRIFGQIFGQISSAAF